MLQCNMIFYSLSEISLQPGQQIFPQAVFGAAADHHADVA